LELLNHVTGLRMRNGFWGHAEVQPWQGVWGIVLPRQRPDNVE